MKVTFLSAIGYTDPSKNNGDCILVDNGSELVIYDCGCEEHARRVAEYMDKHAYSKAKLVLSTTMQTTSMVYPTLLSKISFLRFIRYCF